MNFDRLGFDNPPGYFIFGICNKIFIVIETMVIQNVEIYG